MEDYLPMKLKRKDLEDINDDFSDFSLSSPARKIRRLDSELPPIIEDEECDIPLVFEQSVPQEQRFGVRIEELPDLPENEERAIVIFKPPNPLLQPPSNFSVSVDPHLISGFKNQVLWSNRSNSLKLPNNEAAGDNNNSDASNDTLAVVPWVPSQLPSASGTEFSSQDDNSEMMDVQEVDEASSMDVEDGNGIEQRNNVNEVGMMSFNEGFHQWQQQHCMIPQPPYNTTTPLVWYR